MSYFLKEKAQRQVEVRSSIDGKEVIKTGYLKEITISRQKTLIDLASDFNEAYNSPDKSAEEKEDAMAEYFLGISNAMFDWDGGNPPKEFFISEDFEYEYFRRLVDFFLMSLIK